MVRVRMVEADDVFSALTPFALDTNQFLWIDVIAIVRRVIARIAGAGDAGYSLRAIVRKLAEQDSAAFIGVGFFAMLAERSVDGAGNREHLKFKRSEVGLQR